MDKLLHIKGRSYHLPNDDSSLFYLTSVKKGLNVSIIDPKSLEIANSLTYPEALVYFTGLLDSQRPNLEKIADSSIELFNQDGFHVKNRSLVQTRVQETITFLNEIYMNIFQDYSKFKNK